MVELGIRGACCRKSIRTTRRDKTAALSSDYVNRNFNTTKVDELLVSDLTYIPTNQGWLYLVCILDVYSRRILRWSMADNMKVDLFLDALKQLQITRSKSVFAGTIFHSDHGSQYTSYEFRSVLKAMGMVQSMGTVGDSYDNALAENLWSLLKRESGYSENFESIDEARASIFEWIIWYNNERIHTSIENMPPAKFEQQFANMTENEVE
jgi:putative transposase